MKATKETTQSLSDWVISRIDHSTQDPNVGFVETLYHTCSTALVYLWRSRFRLIPHDSYKNTLKKDVANIRLWEENFPPGHLDTILGQSCHLKTNVIENLKGIGNILMPYFAGYDRTTTSGQNQRNSAWDLAQELDTQLEKATIMLSAEESSDSSSDDEVSDDSSSTIEREQNRLGRIHCYVSCLMDLAPVIDKHISFLQRKVEPRPTPLENVIRLSQSAQPFAMRIRDRFTIALTPLVERLAEANWERSIRIRAQEEEEEPYLADHDALTLFKPYSLFNDSGLGTSVPTRSQYAATAASHTSFLSVAGKEAHGRPRVPSLPQEGGLPFQCDYCRKTISLRNRIEWKIHVFADLQSYLCTHAECEDAMKTFPSRKLWADHEFNEHFTRIQWRCFMCNTTTVTQQLFVDHLIICRNIPLAGHRLTAAISEAQETVLKPEFKDYKYSLEAYTDMRDANFLVTGLPDAPSSFVDTTIRSSKQQTNMAQMGVECTENLASQDVEADPEAEQKLMDNTLPTEVVEVLNARSSGEAQVKHASLSKQQSLSPLQQHLTPPVPQPYPVYYPAEGYPRPVQDVEARAKEGMDVFDASASTKKPDVGYGSLEPTRCWSVPEQRDFKMMLSHFGRDFEGISKFMKTKTTVMVRDFFQQRLDSGQKEFEEIVAEAEAKKVRGEPTGSLPVPSAAPKWQYEATYPHITHHRPQADGLLSREAGRLVVPTSPREKAQPPFNKQHDMPAFTFAPGIPPGHQLAKRQQQDQERERRRAIEQRQAEEHAKEETRRQQIAAQQAQGQLAAQKQNHHPMAQPNGISQGQQSSPVIRNQNPHTASSPLVGNTMPTQAVPMTITASGSGSPLRPPSALQHTHANVMSHPIAPSRTQQGPSRHSTPQMTQGTPAMSHTTPIMRNVTPTQRIGHSSPNNPIGQTPQQQTLISAATQANGPQMDQNRQPMNPAQRYTQLYQQRLLRMRYDMSQRLVVQYGPPSQYPPSIAQQYGPDLEKTAKEWAHDVMRRERENGQQQM
ncbi:hypothetical protein N7447_004063 [Penicillium robsamsonii]|uniref:uncharacterized protein n=1 Tax=Penicillium robsamsonii TaxID=1792511 RepID=UPI002548F078|nr:uncharacterized protein N7447_004063 [Penicillium robsamsonii]KAJ5827300.1 hypothetical protein N7447_004063 [Penicillium robsamsonii]